MLKMFKRICAVSAAAMVIVFMASCTFFQMDIPEQPSMPQLTPGVSAVQFRAIDLSNLTVAGGRSAFRGTPFGEETGEGVFAINRVDRDIVSFDLQLQSTSGDFIVLSQTMYITDTVVSVNGGILPVLSTSRVVVQNQNVGNAVLFEFASSGAGRVPGKGPDGTPGFWWPDGTPGFSWPDGTPGFWWSDGTLGFLWSDGTPGFVGPGGIPGFFEPDGTPGFMSHGGVFGSWDSDGTPICWWTGGIPNALGYWGHGEMLDVWGPLGSPEFWGSDGMSGFFGPGGLPGFEGPGGLGYWGTDMFGDFSHGGMPDLFGAGGMSDFTGPGGLGHWGESGLFGGWDTGMPGLPGLPGLGNGWDIGFGQGGWDNSLPGWNNNFGHGGWGNDWGNTAQGWGSGFVALSHCPGRGLGGSGIIFLPDGGWLYNDINGNPRIRKPGDRESRCFEEYYQERRQELERREQEDERRRQELERREQENERRRREYERRRLQLLEEEAGMIAEEPENENKHVPAGQQTGFPNEVLELFGFSKELLGQFGFFF
ncbi:MAG: hypothetical protein FWC97_09725 [Treponema sp.]|nr:hypothetical protein [Treponema sp.]